MPIPIDFLPPARISAKEKAFNQLQRWIIDGTLMPGEKLYDAEIAEALSISRTPVREAFQLLQIQGFIETFPGRETRVTTISKKDVLKIYPPLASLQALAAEEATKVISIEQIEQLKEINQKYELSINNQQFFRSMEIDEEFHNLILDIADNPYISDFSSTLQLHIRRLKYIFLKQQLTSKNDSLKEHGLIIKSFTERDGKTASIIMKQNWLRPMEELYKVLD
ncbi:GntR family transcriptional regulator [Thermoflavimicrobium daqui]|uniref:GntR family transcriptional regulator n=1 Tax=Thermoflavimicrobium daqui TaxID=2137476 RepID=A0A364K4B5_9BACL|nr:GntR family transcriptional regulator [Thermoflavimicrobium daqui]RAL24186.1 GntR family transcriptional regulator [Thermoflavimicrobium daqui]